MQNSDSARELIDSPQNQHVRFFRSLQSPKGRREHFAFLAEGPRVVSEAIAAGWEVVAAAVCEQMLRPAARPVAEALRSGPWPCYEMTPRAFKALSAEQNPQGVAIAARQRLVPLAQISPAAGQVVVVAWDVADPGNMGTLIRTAEFLGALALIAVGKCVDFFEPKVVRATAGAIFHLPLSRATEAEFTAWAGEKGIQLIATILDGGLSLSEVGPLQQAAALLVGNEAHGLPAEAIHAAHLRVGIPRRGKTESLNVAVAAGIVLWALTQGERGKN